MEYLIHLLVISGIYVILAMSLNLIVGYIGLPALGHAAFSCIGAYTSAIIVLRLGLSPWVGLIAGISLAIIAGLISSFPAIRLKGDYLALATLGFNVIIYGIANNWIELTQGPMGLPGIPSFSIFKFKLTETWQYFLLILFFDVLSFIFLWRIVDSPLGRILKGIREDERAIQMLGINTVKYKVLVFMIGAGFAGLAGVLYTHYITFIAPSNFTIMESISILLMVIFGGMASLYGSIIGAISLVFLPELLRFLGLPPSVAAPLRQMIYGFLLVVLMLKRPQGILGEYKFK